MKTWIIIGLIIIIILVILILVSTRKTSKNYYKKASRYHKKAEKYHQLGDKELSEDYNREAEYLRKKAMELENVV